jgi:flavin-dependent dehydrogenase
MRSGTLILGGGPAGATAAIVMASAGRDVTLIERSRGPADKVCGDFVSAEAVEHLASMGVGVFDLGGQRITRMRLVHRGHVVETRLPFVAAGLSRRILDEALLRVAEARGARVMRGHTIRAVRAAPSGIVVRVDAMGELSTDTAFLATGKHDLRDTPRPHPRGGPLGMKMYYRVAPEQRAALGEAVELILFPGGYAGLLPVAADRLVLCLTVGEAALERAGGWFGLCDSLRRVCPLLDQRLDAAEPLLDRPLAVARIPYGYLHRHAPGDLPALFRIGDQACVIPSLTGDGISIAVHSAALAARIVLAGNGAADYARALRKDLLWQMRRAAAIRAACMAPTALLRFCQAAPWVMRTAAELTRVSAASIRT